MKNELKYVTTDYITKLKQSLLETKNTFCVELFGEELHTVYDYVNAIEKTFHFPVNLPSYTLDWMNDYICDLSWIKEKSIVLIIRNFDKMLIDYPKEKNDIILDYEEIILPWWEKDVIGHMVGGFTRAFSVYLETERKTAG